MGSLQNPLRISVILLSYNQENFIKQAAESLLMQEGPSLELIFSDDYSQDSTYDILQECVRSYTGPHKVILNRNTENLHILRHYNKAFSLASGDWVVVAGGDDISYPSRCLEIRRVIEKNPSLMSVCSNVDIIDDEGNLCDLDIFPTSPPPPCDANIVLTIKQSKYLPVLLGGATAWSRILLNQWLPLPQNVYWEDFYLTFCLILSRGAYERINQPLLQYRQGKHNASRLAVDFTSSASLETAMSFYKKTNERFAISCFSLEALIRECLNGKRTHNMQSKELIQLKKMIHTLGKSHQVASRWWEMPLWKKILYYPDICGLHRLGSFSQLAKLQSRDAYIQRLMKRYLKTGKTSGLF